MLIFFSKVFIPTLSLANQIFIKEKNSPSLHESTFFAKFKVSIAALVRDGLLRALTLAHQRCPQSRSVALSLCRVMGKVWGKGMGWVGTGGPLRKGRFFLAVLYDGLWGVWVRVWRSFRVSFSERFFFRGWLPYRFLTPMGKRLLFSRRRFT